MSSKGDAESCPPSGGQEFGTEVGGSMREGLRPSLNPPSNRRPNTQMPKCSCRSCPDVVDVEHVGNVALVGLTFAAGLAWSAAYRRWPNVWLLAASHTVLAALAYPLVLGDAPLARL